MIKDIKKIGLKDYILWKTLVNIEMILNIPYFILKIIVEIFYYIFDELDTLFSNSRFIYLTWFKPIRKYHSYIIAKFRGEKYE